MSSSKLDTEREFPEKSQSFVVFVSVFLGNSSLHPEPLPAIEIAETCTVSRIAEDGNTYATNRKRKGEGPLCNHRRIFPTCKCSTSLPVQTNAKFSQLAVSIPFPVLK